MKPSFIILSALAALAAASPMERRQCAGCEAPAGKGSSASTSNPNVNTSSNASNSNSNSNSNSVNVVNQLPSGTTPGGNSSGGTTPGGNGSGGTTPGGNGNVKPRCQDCIEFCGEHGDIGNALCKIVVCGIVCAGI